MIYLGTGRNSKEQILAREKRYCLQNLQSRDTNHLPPFSWGEEFLIGRKTNNSKEEILEFSRKWMADPAQYLDLKAFILPKVSQSKNIISFPRLLNSKKDKSVFYLSFPPKSRTSKKVAARVAAQKELK